MLFKVLTPPPFSQTLKGNVRWVQLECDIAMRWCCMLYMCDKTGFVACFGGIKRFHGGIKGPIKCSYTWGCMMLYFRGYFLLCLFWSQDQSQYRLVYFKRDFCTTPFIAYWRQNKCYLSSRVSFILQELLYTFSHIHMPSWRTTNMVPSALTQCYYAFCRYALLASISHKLSLHWLV